MFFARSGRQSIFFSGGISIFILSVSLCPEEHRGGSKMTESLVLFVTSESLPEKHKHEYYLTAERIMGYRKVIREYEKK